MWRTALYVLLVAICCSAAPPAGRDLPMDTPANRKAAAERYLKAVPPGEMIEDTIQRLAVQLPENRREEFRHALAEVLNSQRLEKITMEAVVKHFTVREIRALEAFYSSPEGRSINKKFGAYLADVTPKIQEELRRALEEFPSGKFF